MSSRTRLLTSFPLSRSLETFGVVEFEDAGG